MSEMKDSRGIYSIYDTFTIYGEVYEVRIYDRKPYMYHLDSSKGEAVPISDEPMPETSVPITKDEAKEFVDQIRLETEEERLKKFV